MAFQEAYEAFVSKHRKGRSGEDLRRLDEGHGHAERLFLEQVWWPAIGQFDDLFPEYQVTDFKGGSRYLDFAWIRSPYRICIEIDGYGPHQRDVNRWQYADHLQRQNDLVLDDWIVIRFSYDDVKDRPRLCERTLQQVQGKWLAHKSPKQSLGLVEKKIIQLMVAKGELIPRIVAEELNFSSKTARQWLNRLTVKGIFVPASGKERIRKYRFNPQGGVDRYLRLL